MGQKNGRDEVVIAAPITHQDIADSLHMIRETASREIDRLRQKGLVYQRHRRFVVPNMNQLRQEMATIRDES